MFATEIIKISAAKYFQTYLRKICLSISGHLVNLVMSYAHIDAKNKHAVRKKEQCKKSYKVTSKAIMKPTQLRSKYLKLRTDEIKSISTRQPNFCVSLIRKSKKRILYQSECKWYLTG